MWLIRIRAGDPSYSMQIREKIIPRETCCAYCMACIELWPLHGSWQTLTCEWNRIRREQPGSSETFQLWAVPAYSVKPVLAYAHQFWDLVGCLLSVLYIIQGERSMKSKITHSRGGESGVWNLNHPPATIQGCYTANFKQENMAFFIAAMVLDCSNPYACSGHECI